MKKILVATSVLLMLSLLISACGSMAQMFSPTTTMVPHSAAPTAMDSQWYRAMSVDPRAPVKNGTSRSIFCAPPTCVEMSTAWKTALSGSGSMPIAPTQEPWMLKCEKSIG